MSDIPIYTPLIDLVDLGPSPILAVNTFSVEIANVQRLAIIYITDQ